ncbi:multidrug resistance-associated ABC transporter [Thelephora terrestris]|uniref:Multidrug resistance-associated ABC transporter n=1 Tax=Thelephora terrestris TaxID=56493 RepID=A0A9P6L9A9_9AGAM|nr:multidrug resistance-associated ABC transporter [Thelephora terrestris]
MPDYQFPASIGLAAAAAISATVNLSTSKHEGGIKLEGPEGEREYDPFDVTTPEDVAPGEPIEGPRFWSRIRLVKFVLLLNFAAILILQTISVGWSFATLEPKDAIVPTLNAFTALYLIVITISTLNDEIPDVHFTQVVHIAAITTIAALVFGSIAILPSSQITISGQAGDSDSWALHYAVVGLYAVACAISLNIPRGPALHFPPEQIYSEKTVESTTSRYRDNVCGIVNDSIFGMLFFSYTTKVVMLGHTTQSLEIGDLPIVSFDMRATYLFRAMRDTMKNIKPIILGWKPKPGSGLQVGIRLFKLNAFVILLEMWLAAFTAVLFYAPAFFLRCLVAYLETDPLRLHREWGAVYALGLFVSGVILTLASGQLWSISTTTLQVRLRVQLNSILFSKTLVRKDLASTGSNNATGDEDGKNNGPTPERDAEESEDDFSSKAQIMTLMTTDVDRVSDFSWHLFTLVDAPVEIVVGTIFLYNLLGVSCLFGLLVTCLFLPLNHFAGKVIVNAQDNLMKARDERVSLMNEILGAIRMIKFMAWERSFESRVHKVRRKELKYQRRNYLIEVLFNAIWNSSPIFVTLVAFWHFTVVRGQTLTPSIAFTSLTIFDEMKFALNAIPETLINMLQSVVSLRRIEKYLLGAEVSPVPPPEEQDGTIAFQNATFTWPQERMRSASNSSSAASTPKTKFVLMDLSITFPRGELSLICGKLGSGKTLLLLSLLGEADILAGQVLCPRSTPDAIASFQGQIPSRDEWIRPNVCAYVPQTAWLRNASIKDNILFNLPYVEERYQKTLEACALISDLKILEDGDEAEIGERGVNLSGGQKARVSLARAVYSRASILFLDDVLSAVDAHTADHLYNECLRGELMEGRTVILVSHHVQLCAPGANHVIVLDNGRVQFQGDREGFYASGIINGLVQSGAVARPEEDEAKIADTEALVEAILVAPSETSSTIAPSTTVADSKPDKKKAPRKLVEEEKRAVGRIGKDVWLAYTRAAGGRWYWIFFFASLVLAAIGPIAEKGWITRWSGATLRDEAPKSPMWYISIYAAITGANVVISTLRWFILYQGSIRASVILYERLLEGVLFAKIRFHDTVSRGRLLNRFGKDFEGIDSSLSDNLGRSIINGLSVLTTFITISVVGGWPFVAVTLLVGVFYFEVAKVYGQTARDMRRLDSVTRSPLYSLYGETIAGVSVLRAFGASSKFMRDMLRCVDTNSNPYYWMWGVNRWISSRFNVLSNVVIGCVALIAVFSYMDAALAGFALAFSATVVNDLLFMVRRFVGLEQAMVAVERVKEYSELEREPPEFVEPRPAASWPTTGRIECRDLVIRYSPELPNVLHGLTFEVCPGEKVGILGRTGSGKSTLALSFFRFVEATEGKILIDGVDLSEVGLTDLRSRLTIIPQDPTILSGTLRSTLDVFNEYEDPEIFEALRRVHLIPGSEEEDPVATINANVFRDLDSPVSEGGDNFSTGEKQLLCMARAILKRSKVLLMDEATASVDYATDELIGKTIRHEFAESTILTIAHRLRTVIDYNRVMLLEDGRIVEFDTPANLLADVESKFYALCKATGKDEFSTLRRLAGVMGGTAAT